MISYLESRQLGDSRGYPAGWKRYCLEVGGKKETPSANWSIFSARYRAAVCFRGCDFDKFGKRTERGYEAGVRYLLSYSAFEASCKAINKETYKIKISADTPLHINTRRDLRKELETDSGQYLRDNIQDKRLLERVEHFIADNNETNLRPIASVLRNLIAHGIWTPGGGRLRTKQSCRTLDNLGQILLLKGEELFNLEFDS